MVIIFPIMRLFFFSHAFKFEKYFYQLYSAFLITFTALFQYKGFFFSLSSRHSESQSVVVWLFFLVNLVGLSFYVICFIRMSWGWLMCGCWGCLLRHSLTIEGATRLTLNLRSSCFSFLTPVTQARIPVPGCWVFSSPSYAFVTRICWPIDWVWQCSFLSHLMEGFVKRWHYFPLFDFSFEKTNLAISSSSQTMANIPSFPVTKTHLHDPSPMSFSMTLHPCLPQWHFYLSHLHDTVNHVPPKWHFLWTYTAKG